MPKLTKIYTRKGDDGTTRLGGNQRIRKDELRVHAYGTVDELNSQIGVALATGLCDRLKRELMAIQNELFRLGSDLCFIEPDKQNMEIPGIEARHVDKLEALMDDLLPLIGPLANFILPGGTMGAAQLQLARAVCRRAERAVISLAQVEPIGAFVIPYLNRLSDALFVMARYENHERNQPEPLWDSHA